MEAAINDENFDDNESLASYQMLLQANKMEAEASQIQAKQQADNGDSKDTFSGSSVDLTIRHNPKAKTFVKRFKNKLMKECQEATNNNRAPDIRNIIVQAADATELNPDLEKIASWRFPDGYDFFDDNDVAAIFRLLIARGTKNLPEQGPHHLNGCGFQDHLLFEPAKTKWIDLSQR